MVDLARRGVLSLLVLGALFAVPSVASAQRGGYDYESFGCSSERVSVKNGTCDASRPAPSISAMPTLPLAGGPVKLTADSPGRGLTYAWDLDDDGAFDDAVGAEATTTFATAGSKRVRVRATDEDGRTGEATQTLQVHVTNLKPQAIAYVTPNSPRAGQPVAVSIYAYDDDGSVVAVDLDLDGDGTYEVHETVAPGAEAIVDTTVTFATAGQR